MLVVFTVLNSDCADIIFVSSWTGGELVYFKHAASSYVLAAFIGAYLFVCLLAWHYKHE